MGAFSFSFGGGPRGMLASDISNLRCWYRAGVGTTLVSGRVSVWNNSIASPDTTEHLTDASTANRRPLYTAADSDFGGLPSVYFDDSTRKLVSGTLTSSIAMPQTWVLACKKPVLGSNAYAFDQTTGGAPVLYKADGTEDIYMLDTSLGAITAPAAVGVLAVVWNGASSKYYHNTVSPTTWDSGAAHTVTSLRMGNVALTSGWKIAEACIYSGAVSNVNLTKLILALGARYGITIA